MTFRRRGNHLPTFAKAVLFCSPREQDRNVPGHSVGAEWAGWAIAQSVFVKPYSIEKYLSCHFMVFYLLLSHPDFKCFLRHCFYCLSYLITSNPRTIEKSHYIYCLQTCCKTPYCNNVTDIAQSSAVVNLINIK